MIIKENNVTVTHPEIIRNWNNDKNHCPPEHYTSGSNKKLWWKCDECNYEWVTIIPNQIKSNYSCPACSGHHIHPGYNDLATLYPEVASQWDHEKNNVTPDQVFPKTRKKYWWICSENHSWEASCDSRVNSNGCPVCSGKKVVPGVNDVLTMYPEIEGDWSLEDNGDPRKIFYNTKKKLWWITSCGHKWKSNLDYKLTGGGCRVCSGQVLLSGYNDLGTLYPNLAAEYSDKNDRKVNEILPGSKYKARWECSVCSHQWVSEVYRRVRRGHGCSVCSGKKVVKGFNDLITTHPHFSVEWDYDKNDHGPEHYSFGSRKKAWWKCSEGHSWLSEIGGKISQNSGCPVCANKLVISGVNDVFTTNIELLEYWDYEKNTIEPQSLSAVSTMVVNWKCSEGHEWSSPVYRMRYSERCPVCYPSGSSQEISLYNYVNSLVDSEIVRNNRTVLNGLELDIYIPEKNIAIEYNGLFWHTELFGKDQYYHYDKWLECKEKGIQLITIWEDDWVNKNDVVKKMIKHKLGVDDSSKVFARKTIVKELSYHTSKIFCDANHIQGSVSGTFYAGLFDDNNIVAVSVWRKQGDILYLDRYCTSVNVVGGMGKLLKYGKNLAKENNCSRIITFADHEVSDGGLYDRLGFTKEEVLKPDYKYFYKGVRNHKFGFRKNKFKNDSELVYDDSLTEKELAIINNIPRIWDCGKTRYTLNI